MTAYAPPFVATYRIQLRNGVDLDAVRARIPWLVDLGVSHIYLAPLFRAPEGSTHGYDVIDPNVVDPVLGGQPAFERLADAARDAGLGIVLDIVPNHMAFTPENPFIADVMQYGRDSRHAALFDIEWDAGRLHFPTLDGTPAELLAAGQLAMGKGTALRVYDQDHPLRATPLAAELSRGDRTLDAATLEQLLEEQYWSLGHWRDSADAIIHRRFFNITGLIGVRQEDPAVFDATHRWIVEQVAAGRVQGLRVDHIDGLARPTAYLHRLRAAVGGVPIWVEKIVKDDEAIPDAWPIEGMSGYEFMGSLTQLLTDRDGLSTIRAAAAGCVPEPGPEVRKVRRELLANVFMPEVDRVDRAAAQAGAEGLRDAIVALAIAWPVYRSYAADGLPLGAMFDGIAAQADVDRDRLLALLTASEAPARRFAARFEQLTGALTAKSEEDTVFFRAVAYLPLCEVGAGPELDAIPLDRFAARMAARAARTPMALTALSTHDTKRSADARAAIVALSHLPALAARLFGQARAMARSAGIDERWGVYALQIALMLRNEDAVDTRIADHLAKAMRESKDASSYEAPELDAEEGVSALCCTMLQALRDHDLWSEEEARAFVICYEEIVLAQLMLQLSAPGVPDIYQGTEGLAVDLTDPDNRRPVDWHALATEKLGDLAGRKLAMTRRLLALRRDHAALFAHGAYAIEATPSGWTVRRFTKDADVEIDIPAPVGADREIAGRTEAVASA